jgi:hypothetical protein
MDDIIYKFYKDDMMFHEGTCPPLFFASVIPTNDQNLFDYVEIIYKGRTLIHYKEKGINEWKP